MCFFYSSCQLLMSPLLNTFGSDHYSSLVYCHLKANTDKQKNYSAGGMYDTLLVFSLHWLGTTL